MLKTAHTSLLRQALASRPLTTAARGVPHQLSICQQSRKAHAVSNPTLADIEKRWTEMPPQEQADLWMALRDRMKVDWHELTMQEKKAAWYIAFGPHGPRELPAPDHTWQVTKGVLQALVASAFIFGLTQYFARGRPGTMTREWEEKTNEYFKRENIEPISGVSSEGYRGKGQVQSAPARKQ